MKNKQTQPTPISEEEYKRFKQWVQDVHGTTRGHLSTEIENALREYRQPDNNQDKLSRIEDDLASVKAMVAESEGVSETAAPTPETPNTHAHADGGKPNPNAPRSVKVDYIISEYYHRDGGSTTVDAIQTQIKEAFGFGDRTVEEYQELILDELGAEPHPATQGVYAWGDNLEQAVERHQEQVENDVHERMEELE